MKKSFLSISARNTQRVAKKLGKDIFNFNENKDRNNQSIIIAMKGVLGSGKTTFVQGLAEELEIKDKVISPTFIIMKKYKIFNNKYRERYPYFYHLDLYRLDSVKDISFLNLDKIITSSNIIVIEWSEKIKEMLPQNTIFVEFIDTLKHMKFSKNLRKIKIDY